MMDEKMKAAFDAWGVERSKKIAALGMSRGELVLHAQDLTYQRDELLAALKDAREDIEEWACYSSQYFREKHKLEACLTRYDALIARMEEVG